MSAKVELHLTSGSLTRKGSADDALVYRLDEESEARGLPAVHQAHPWAGKKVSALRDRLADTLMCFCSALLIPVFSQAYDRVGYVVSRVQETSEENG